MAMNFPVPIGLNTDELGRGMRLISCPVLSLVGMLMSRLMIPCSSHIDLGTCRGPMARYRCVFSSPPNRSIKTLCSLLSNLDERPHRPLEHCGMKHISVESWLSSGLVSIANARHTPSPQDA